jgi:hypothetical protein
MTGLRFSILSHGCSDLQGLELAASNDMQLCSLSERMYVNNYVALATPNEQGSPHVSTRSSVLLSPLRLLAHNFHACTPPYMDAMEHQQIDHLSSLPIELRCAIAKQLTALNDMKNLVLVNKTCADVGLPLLWMTSTTPPANSKEAS